MLANGNTELVLQVGPYRYSRERVKRNLRKILERVTGEVEMGEILEAALLVGKNTDEKEVKFVKDAIERIELAKQIKEKQVLEVMIKEQESQKKVL